LMGYIIGEPNALPCRNNCGQMCSSAALLQISRMLFSGMAAAVHNTRMFRRPPLSPCCLHLLHWFHKLHVSKRFCVSFESTDRAEQM